MDRNIGLEAVRLTEAAAMASARVMGRGDEKLADQAAFVVLVVFFAFVIFNDVTKLPIFYHVKP